MASIDKSGREKEDWRPVAGYEQLRARARLLRAVREFFHSRGVMEVETPALSTAASTAPYLDSYATEDLSPGRCFYLHTSPEFPMKRLLAAAAGPIYQVCKVFRRGEIGRYHNPEFTLLEWYRPGFDHHRLMDEVEALVGVVLDRGPVQRLSYAEVFQRGLGVDPHNASCARLREAAARHGLDRVVGLDAEDRDGWLDLLLDQVVIPAVGTDTALFVYDYPASQASLARVRPSSGGGEPALAERFELYIDGVELANGFHELADAAEQRRRFEQELQQRRLRGQPEVPMDRRLLAALSHGLPDCAGVALGIDRLLLLIAGMRELREVIAFPLERA